LRFERRGTIAVSLNGSGRLKASLRKIANIAGEAKAPEALRHDELKSEKPSSVGAAESAGDALLFRDDR
jgi:hypothetical protein